MVTMWLDVIDLCSCTAWCPAGGLRADPAHAALPEGGRAVRSAGGGHHYAQCLGGRTCLQVGRRDWCWESWCLYKIRVSTDLCLNQYERRQKVDSRDNVAISIMFLRVCTRGPVWWARFRWQFNRVSPMPQQPRADLHALRLAVLSLTQFSEPLAIYARSNCDTQLRVTHRPPPLTLPHLDTESALNISAARCGT